MTPANAFSTVDDVHELVLRTLSNGLRVVLIDLPNAHSVASALMVRTGPRFERPEENGLGHLVEHLLFRGTRSHPSSLEYHVAVETIGGEVNGLTQRDATTVHMTVTPDRIRDGLMLLGELCTEPLLTGLAVERDVVLEEILDSTDAEGNDLDIDSLARRAMWPGHPMSLPVAGDAELVESFTERECRAFFERTFVAKNGVLAVAGPIPDVTAVLGWCEEGFGRMPTGAPMPEPGSPRPAARPPIQVQSTDDSQVGMLLSFPAPSELDSDFAALLMMKRILDDGFASRLRQDICERRGLAYSLSVGIDAYQDAGALDIEVSCAPRKLYAVVEQVLQTLRELQEQPVTEAELDRAKVRHRADLMFSLDDPSEICGWYGASVLIGSTADYEDRLSEVMSLRPSHMHDLARSLLRTEDALLTLLGPAEERTVLRLERLLGRAEGSTVWLGEEMPDEGADEPSTPGPRLIAG